MERLLQLNCAGYVRVSSKDQIDGESLTTQRKSIADFAKLQGYKLTEIYADEGISGATSKDRPALLKCLNDAQNKKFNVLIIHRLSRFGRNASQLLENVETLNKSDVELRSISEGIDFSSTYGRAMLGMLAVIAQLEKDIIREQMLENRIGKGKRGVPTSGRLPYGRLYNKETGLWSLDEKQVNRVTSAAKEFLEGGKLYDIAKKYKFAYNNLLEILKTKCSDKFTVQFEGENLLTYEVPRILSDHTIQQICERLKLNRRNNRIGVNGGYLLSGFLRCEKCLCLLSGQTQSEANQYYTHVPKGEYNNCNSFASVVLKPLEKAVFETIFENIVDVPNFEKAIADSLPDEKMISNLKINIAESEKELKGIQKEINKLVEMALAGTLSKESIKAKEKELIEMKSQVTENLHNYTIQLNSLPDIETMKNEANVIRRFLLEKFSGKRRLSEMSFDDKRNLLFWLFNGKDEKGTPHGIYITKKGKGETAKIDYFLYGKLQGLRTLKGNDINYQKWDEDDNINISQNNTTSYKYKNELNINFKVHKTT